MKLSKEEDVELGLEAALIAVGRGKVEAAGFNNKHKSRYEAFIKIL